MSENPAQLIENHQGRNSLPESTHSPIDNISGTLQQTLIEAIENQQLRLTLWHLEERISEFSLPEQRAFRNANAAVGSLDDEVVGELTKIVLALREVGIKVTMAGLAYPDRILHVLKLDIKRQHLDRSALVLEEHGYQCKHRSAGGNQWHSFIRFNEEVTFVSKSGSQFQIRLKWKLPYRINNRFVSALWPTEDDLQAIPLPKVLWPAYSLVKVFRSVFSRKKIAGDTVDLGPFIGTPEGLIVPLLQFAGLKEDDHLLDLGSGDGRVLISAAQAYDCRCRGYETDSKLVETFHQNFNKAGFEPRFPIEVVCGDAMSADISEATIVFLFLPVKTVRTLVPNLLKKMKPGARLIVHEQEMLRIEPAPDQSLPLISESGVTIVHKWIAPSSRVKSDISD